MVIVGNPKHFVTVRHYGHETVSVILRVTIVIFTGYGLIRHKLFIGLVEQIDFEIAVETPMDKKHRTVVVILSTIGLSTHLELLGPGLDGSIIVLERRDR